VIWRRLSDPIARRLLLFFLVLYPFFVWFINLTQLPFIRGYIDLIVYVTYIPLAAFIYKRLIHALHLETHPDPKQIAQGRRMAIVQFTWIAIVSVAGVVLISQRRMDLAPTSEACVRRQLPDTLSAESGELGQFIVYTDVSLVGKITFGSERTRTPAKADYVAIGMFENGDARITVRLAQPPGQDWHVETLRIDPLPKKAAVI
jgi:hypothetical protein